MAIYISQPPVNERWLDSPNLMSLHIEMTPFKFPDIFMGNITFNGIPFDPHLLNKITLPEGIKIEYNVSSSNYKFTVDDFCLLHFFQPRYISDIVFEKCKEFNDPVKALHFLSNQNKFVQ